MTSTPTIDTEPPAADVVVGASVSDSEVLPEDAMDEAAGETAGSEVALDLRSAGEILIAQIQAATALLKGLPKQLVKASSDELAAVVVNLGETTGTDFLARGGWRLLSS